MKRLAAILLFITPFFVKATNYTSIASGNWATSTTWSPTGVPGASDNVTIANTFTVTLSANESVNNFTINSGGTLTVSTTKTLTVNGNYTDNGTFTYATRTVIFSGTANQTLGGSATLTFYKLTIDNTGSSGSNSVTLGAAITVNNTLTLTAGILDVSSSNYQLTCEGTFTNNNNTAALNAESGTVDLGGGVNSITVNGSSGTTFYNLTSDAGSGNTITSTTDNETVTNNLVVSTGTLSMGTVTLAITGNVTINSSATLKFTSGTLNLEGNYVNNGTFTYGTSTVNFDATSIQNHNQTISGSASPMPFYNLTTSNLGSTNDTLLLQCAITLHQNFTISNGVFACQTYQITGNSAGTVTMSSGSYLMLGLTSSTTSVLFPTAYINTLLDDNSTVVYQANTASQKISTAPSQYGNVILSTGSTAVAKTASNSNYLTVENFTVNGNVTFNEIPLQYFICNGNVINNGVITLESNISSTCFMYVYGSLTNNGNFTLATTTGLNLYGNLINNGTFNAGYATVVAFLGSANQTIGGTKGIIWRGGDLNVNKLASTDTIFLDVSIRTGGLGVGNGMLFVPSTKNDTITYTGGSPFGFSGSGKFYAENGIVIIDTTLSSGSLSGSFSFYNLTIDPSVSVSFNNWVTYSVKNTLTISTGATLVPGKLVNIGGNMTNNGTFTYSTSTINFNGSKNQIIGGSGTTAFHNLTCSQSSFGDTLFLSSAISVNDSMAVNSGVLDCQNYQITGNATGTMTMASGSSMVLGLPSSATAIAFPTSFTTAHTTLNANSNVIYQANAAQTISSVPSAYGNLILSTGSTAATKTTGSSSLTVVGNLTINSNTTLSGISSALALGGNFTNNGTFTTSTSNLIFNGSGTQTIGGTTTTSFYNITLANTGIVQPSYALSISKSLRIQSGTLNATTSNYNLTIGGGFVNNGGTFTPHSDKVTLNGSSNDTLGGSATLSLDTLVIANSGTTYLGGNVTTVSNVTINSGLTTLNGLSHTLTTAGNFIDNGTFTSGTSTVSFNRNGHQCIQGSSTPTFNNLTVGALSILGTTGSLNITGTVTVLPGGRMACSCSP